MARPAIEQAIKPCQSLLAKPAGPPELTKTKKNKKNKKNQEKKISATMGIVGLGSHGC
jgi:hypothetical protein